MRQVATAMIAARRPPAMRSRAGRSSGARTRNGGEAEDQEQQDPFPCGVGLDREEQRVGEGDDHRRVAAIIKAWVIARRRNFE